MVRTLSKTLIILSLVALTGCAGTSSRSSDFNLFDGNSKTDQPIQLGARKQTTQQDLLRVSINEQTAKKAIENFRINKKAAPGPYQYSGADLNGDGKPELIVYFTGEAWCAKTGCTLAILSQSRHGYRTISTIRRVKAPVFIAETATNGWRDLFLHTGHGTATEAPQVKLSFGGNGYPGNAITIPPRPKDAVTIGEVIIEHRPTG